MLALKPCNHAVKITYCKGYNIEAVFSRSGME